MICPTCHNVMIVVEHEKIELDYCSNCSGVWFDSGELELMLEGMGLESSDLSPTSTLVSTEAATTEKRRRCPICNRKMKKTTIGKEPKVLIDVCPEGDGLWFDSGEINEIIKQCAQKACAEPGAENRVFTFLGDTFKAENQPT